MKLKNKKKIIFLLGSKNQALFSLFKWAKENKVVSSKELVLKTSPLSFLEEFLFRIRKESLILIINSLPLGERKEIRDFIFKLKNGDWLVLKREEKEKLKISSKSPFEIFIVGDQEGDDLWISDIVKKDKAISFKINYKGSSIPFWVPHSWKDDLFSLLLFIASLILLEKNLVTLSSLFKKFPLFDFLK